MSETSRDLQAELERATTRRLPADVELSKDAAELREGWLALGQLLEASDRSFDPRQLLEKIETRAPSSDTVDVVSPREPRIASSHGAWKRRLAAIVAASLLAAAGLAAWWSWNVTIREPSVVPVARQPVVEQNGSDDPVPETAWDDSFDEQLAVTHERIWQVRATSTVSEARIETLRQAVEQFDSELNSSSL